MTLGDELRNLLVEQKNPKLYAKATKLWEEERHNCIKAAVEGHTSLYVNCYPLINENDDWFTFVNILEVVVKGEGISIRNAIDDRYGLYFDWNWIKYRE